MKLLQPPRLRDRHYQVFSPRVAHEGDIMNLASAPHILQDWRLTNCRVGASGIAGLEPPAALHGTPKRPYGHVSYQWAAGETLDSYFKKLSDRKN